MDPVLEDALVQAVAWIPLHFINRSGQFDAHALDMHWLYPLVGSDDIFNDDAEAKLNELDAPLQPIVRCWELIKHRHAHPVRLYECVLSANAFGTEGRLHRDINHPKAGDRERHHTALVYCSKSWDPDWGGETLVFNDDRSEITAAVMPKRGRVLHIAGDPPHVGRSVSRICPSDRRVLVLKYWAI
ncbi:MAG: 2OG-Fe(II) oxygenase [Janthinobacterium lividum]